MSTITDPGITRDAALALLLEHLKNERLIAHSLASEAIMRKLAQRFDENSDMWGLAGLLHDIDYEMVEQTPEQHAETGAGILEARGVSPDIVNAVRKHNAEGLGLERTTTFEYALTCAETVTGLIAATALVYPDKKISSVKTKSVTKRMKTPHFARAVSRERIMECEKIGISLDDFVTLGIGAMSEIAEELGL